MDLGIQLSALQEVYFVLLSYEVIFGVVWLTLGLLHKNSVERRIYKALSFPGKGWHHIKKNKILLFSNNLG